MKRKDKGTYHHGDLAESLLEAVDEIATTFGLEAVTLRGCAKLVGVSPSSAFRHYTDKRALLTAFATRALLQLSAVMGEARERAEAEAGNGTGTDAEAGTGSGDDGAFTAVGLAYVAFALDKPAFFRAMWHEETIYAHDERYLAAAARLGEHLAGGFASTLEDADPTGLSPQELLAWSSVHGLAALFVDGPVGDGASRDEKLGMARQMIRALGPALTAPAAGVGEG